MTIATSRYGSLEGGRVDLFTLRNAGGSEAKLTDYGARLVGMHVPDARGVPADIVLGFDELAGYVATDTFFGATCGRHANRIRGGRFAIGPQRCELSRNEPPNHLHGGMAGFDRAVWHAEIDAAANTVLFTHHSPDGDEGYPGGLDATAAYTLTDGNELVIRMTATTDRPTVVNLVHHSYWNLAGHASGDVRAQQMHLAASAYTPVDAELLPTGEIVPVAGTAFDFRSPRSIGDGLDALGRTGGFDHNWVIDDWKPGRGPGPLGLCARVVDPGSGRGLELLTTEPGVQFYTGGYIGGGYIGGGYIGDGLAGKGGARYRPFAGFTLETQTFPDGPNQPHFPSAVLMPGDVYEHVMVHRFFAR